MTQAPIHRPIEELFLLGPTAAGKDRVGALLAQALAGRGVATEILGLDSMKVYSGLEVLADSPVPEDRALVRYHLLGIVAPSEVYSVGRYVEDANRAASEVRARGALPMFVGGTSLYYKALVDGLFEGPATSPELRARLEADFAADPQALHARMQAVDPAAAQRIHPNDGQRIVRALEVFELCGRPLSELATSWKARPAGEGIARRVLGLMPDWDELRERIATRARATFAGGCAAPAVAEVARALAAGGFTKQACAGVGVREAIALLDGRCSEEEAVAELTRRTRRLAKMQRTWFRSLEGVEWHLLEPGMEPEEITRRLLETLARAPVSSAIKF